MKIRAAAAIAIVALFACQGAPTGPASCEATALESWPVIVAHADPDHSDIVQDTTAMECTVGETVDQGGLSLGTCICAEG